MNDLSTARSLLFAPADDARKLQKGLAGDADAVVADLEDAVPPARKDAAREVVVDALTAGGPALRVVRVNVPGSDWFEADVELVRRIVPDAMVLPKATPEAIEALPRVVPPVIAIVETAAGLLRAHETASDPRVAALALGAVDLGAELGLEPRPDGLEILYARSQVVTASAAAGIRAPFDVVRLDYQDAEALEEECRLARSLGFRGKMCIHPTQVPVVNRVFAPTADEIAWARRVVEGFEQAVSEGSGVFGLDGTMVDLPVVERARRVLAEARETA
jgi:citrate lyase subunit beta/citryl-CoA lyase